MSREDLTEIAWDDKVCSEKSFRGLISKNLGFDNLNFSSGGSSNQRQFRLAKDFFFSDRFKKLKSSYDEVLILWGITSTARNELFQIEGNNYTNFLYTDDGAKSWPFPKDFLMYSYDHDSSVYELVHEINMFNTLFSHVGAKCIWFDTFNHHDYQRNSKFPLLIQKEKYNDVRGTDWPEFEDYVFKKAPVSIEKTPDFFDFEFKDIVTTDHGIENFMFLDQNPHDLLSLILSNTCGDVFDHGYHYSNWANDNDKITAAVEEKLLNPFSFHPTAHGHNEIYKILVAEISRILSD
jgi:hypothetical protein